MASPEFRTGAGEVRRDAQGREACPECGEYFSARCRNCFHSRHGFDNPDELSPDILASLPPEKK